MPQVLEEYIGALKDEDWIIDIELNSILIPATTAMMMMILWNIFIILSTSKQLKPDDAAED